MIRVFISTSPDGLDAETNMVCEHSIRSRASEPVEITWMRLDTNPESPWYSNHALGKGWETSRWATTFSGFRYAIPAVCGYEGKAIYCDNDVLFTSDIAELWHLPIHPGKMVVAKSAKRLCVSLWDCAVAGRHLAPLPKMQRNGHGVPKAEFERLVQEFPAGQNWNCLDGEGLPLDDPSIKAIHFTDIATQPAVPLAMQRLQAEERSHWFDGQPVEHPRRDLVELFHREYEAALAAGYTLEQYDQSPRFGPVVKRDLSNYRGGPRLAAPAA